MIFDLFTDFLKVIFCFNFKFKNKQIYPSRFMTPDTRPDGDEGSLFFFLEFLSFFTKEEPSSPGGPPPAGGRRWPLPGATPRPCTHTSRRAATRRCGEVMKPIGWGV